MGFAQLVNRYRVLGALGGFDSHHTNKYKTNQ